MYTSDSGAGTYSKVPYVNNVAGAPSNTGVAIPTFSVACNTVLASDGAVGAPMAVTVPACGHVDAAFNDSFYVVTAAGGETLVTLTNLSDDVDLAVFTDASFTVPDPNWWCPFNFGTIPETCWANTAVGLGPVYIQVFNFTTAGATYTLNLSGPPALPPLPPNSVVSTDVPVPIPDSPAPAVTSSLTVSGGPAFLTRVAVEVNITHTFDADLTLTLISPIGTRIVLSANNGGGGDNYTGTVLMDGTGNHIHFGFAPFAGYFDPEELLSGVAGQDANGTWSLEVVDGAPVDTGTIDGWTLYFE
jgi:subtilisin-like proprotein convertase family protein